MKIANMNITMRKYSCLDIYIEVKKDDNGYLVHYSELIYQGWYATPGLECKRYLSLDEASLFEDEIDRVIDKKILASVDDTQSDANPKIISISIELDNGLNIYNEIDILSKYEYLKKAIPYALLEKEDIRKYNAIAMFLMKLDFSNM